MPTLRKRKVQKKKEESDSESDEDKKIVDQKKQKGEDSGSDEDSDDEPESFSRQYNGLQYRFPRYTPGFIGWLLMFISYFVVDKIIRFSWYERSYIFIAFFVFVLFVILKPIKQDPDYHNFADDRGCVFCGTFLFKNLSNVVSNALFIILPPIGINLLPTLEKRSLFGGFETELYYHLFIGTILVGIGSSIYHWNPNNKTLIFDRAPMTYVFVTLFTLILQVRGQLPEDFDVEALYYPLLLFGFISLAYWHVFEDLRLYIIVAFIPFILSFGIIMTCPPFYTKSRYQTYALSFYALAKFCETFDRTIYKLTFEIISGHTIKHLLSGWITAFIIIWLREREVSDYKVLYNRG